MPSGQIMCMIPGFQNLLCISQLIIHIFLPGWFDPSHCLIDFHVLITSEGRSKKGEEQGRFIHFLKTSWTSPNIFIIFATLLFLLSYCCIWLFPSLASMLCCGHFQKPPGALCIWVYPQHRTKALAQSTHLANYGWVCELWGYWNT